MEFDSSAVGDSTSEDETRDRVDEAREHRSRRKSRRASTNGDSITIQLDDKFQDFRMGSKTDTDTLSSYADVTSDNTDAGDWRKQVYVRSKTLVDSIVDVVQEVRPFG